MIAEGLWQRSIDLRALNSFGVAARVALFARCCSLQAVVSALDICPAPPFILGGGSNLLLAGDLEMPVLQPDLRGIRFDPLDEDRVQVSAAAGEPWDGLVQACCERGLWGIENLALIPGTAGAAPVQNIGAYGVELAEHLVWVEAIELCSGSMQRLPAGALRFGYRDSRFKREPGAWLITRIGLVLTRKARPRLGYAGLADALTLRTGAAAHPGPVEVAEAVRALRRSKLPDPSELGNAGSFFKNPEVAVDVADQLGRRWPGLPVFPAAAPGHAKLSAAWLIEAAGCKGLRRGDAGVSARHALVLVNHGAATGAELLGLAEEVAAKVFARFGLALEPEPVVLGGRFRGGA